MIKKILLILAFTIATAFVTASFIILFTPAPVPLDDSMYEDESSEAYEGEVWSDSTDAYLEKEHLNTLNK